MKEKATKPKQNLSNIHPETWNNIPIPVQEAFRDVIIHILSHQSLQTHIESNVMDVCNIMETIITFIEATGIDIRAVVSQKFI